MKIYIARHGQTQFNVENRYGGNSNLTEKGISHANIVGGYLSDIKFSKIYSSTLQRSIDTAKIISKHHKNTEIISLDIIKEVDCGMLEGMSWYDFQDDYPKIYAERKKDKYNYLVPGAESYKTALDRVKPFLLKIISENQDVLLVGHQAINRTMIGYLGSIPENIIPHLLMPNDIVYVFDSETKNVSHIYEGKIINGYVVQESKKP